MFMEYAAGAVFALAILHTFATSLFEKLAGRVTRGKGVLHLLAEVEIVFGVWALVMVLVMLAARGGHETMAYLESFEFTEPMFVFAVMVVAASKPVFNLAERLMLAAALRLPLPLPVSFYLIALTVGPLLGSFITEPAAMTLTAVILYANFYRHKTSEAFKYATVAVLFVNVSIGGVLTHFAAPPVVMVAGKWGFGLFHMFTHFGWKAALAVIANTSLAVLIFRKQFALMERSIREDISSGLTDAAPMWVSLVHAGFLAVIVIFSHHPIVFVGAFLFFLGFVEAFRDHQNELLLRNALLVAFFLSSLIVIGGMQTWWLRPLLEHMESLVLYVGATLLTGITDNAALTYLGSLVEGLSADNKYALLAGAVTGGGLTVIANAPNPAGYSILKSAFPGETISAVKLLAFAAGPTLIAALCLYGLPGPR